MNVFTGKVYLEAPNFFFAFNGFALIGKPLIRVVTCPCCLGPADDIARDCRLQSAPIMSSKQRRLLFNTQIRLQQKDTHTLLMETLEKLYWVQELIAPPADLNPQSLLLQSSSWQISLQPAKKHIHYFWKHYQQVQTLSIEQKIVQNPALHFKKYYKKKNKL